MSKDVLTERTLGGLPVVPVQKRGSFLNFLVYGESGTGKTTLAGSADACPALRPVLVVDFEGGTESLVRSYPDVEQIRVATWKDMQQVYDELRLGNHGFSTVILDSLTEIQKFNMYQIMTDLIERRPDLDPDVPSMREWGKNLEQMRKFVRAFRDLPMNSIFTALVKQDRNDRTGVTTLLPSLSGKLAGEVAAFLDIVGYYYTKQVEEEGVLKEKRLLLTAKTETIVAKDRTQSLPMVVEDPTMQKIYDYINAKAPAAATTQKSA